MSESLRLQLLTYEIKVTALEDMPHVDITIWRNTRINSPAVSTSIPTPFKMANTRTYDFTEYLKYYMYREDDTLKYRIYGCLDIVRIYSMKKGDVLNIPCKLSGWTSYYNSIYVDANPLLIAITGNYTSFHRFGNDKKRYEKLIDTMNNSVFNEPTQLSGGTP